MCALRGWLCGRLEGVKKRFAQVHQGECPVIPLEPLSGALSAPGAAQLGRQGYASPLRALDVAGRPGSLAPARVAPGGMTETGACSTGKTGVSGGEQVAAVHVTAVVEPRPAFAGGAGGTVFLLRATDPRGCGEH